VSASTYPQWKAGMKLTPERLTARQWVQLTKAADQTAPSTAFVDDDTLAVPVEANALYYIIFNVAGYATFDGSGTASTINTEITFPAGTTGFKMCQGPGLTSTDREDTNMVSAVHLLDTDRRYGTEDGSTASVAIEEHLWAQTSTTSGTIQYRFARGNTDTNSAGIIGRSSVAWVRLA
jgi:hypothetical protein